MKWKLITALLAALLLAETAYTIGYRPLRPNRFQPVPEGNGLLALDTVTGRLCRTIPDGVLHPPDDADIEAKFIAALAACENFRR
jgi:hypothetical protein